MLNFAKKTLTRWRSGAEHGSAEPPGGPVFLYTHLKGLRMLAHLFSHYCEYMNQHPMLQLSLLTLG